MSRLREPLDVQFRQIARPGQVDRDVFAGSVSVDPAGLRQRPDQAVLSGSYHNAPGFAGGSLRAPSMNNSLEVEVLYPA